MNEQAPDAKKWTLAYRHKNASTFRRVTNWSGTWHEASDMADRFRALHPDYDTFEIYYVPTREAEISGYSHREDVGNILTDSGKRVWMTETGSLPQELIGEVA